jgi:hypothetical protein
LQLATCFESKSIKRLMLICTSYPQLSTAHHIKKIVKNLVREAI